MKSGHHGRLFVISAPSAAGKSTLCGMLLKRRKDLVFSVSVTTRQPRRGEREGQEYFFVSEAAFLVMRKRNQLLEWAEVHGQYYGTPRIFLEQTLTDGKDVLLDIDVQGALQVKRRFPDAVLIFINAPSLLHLERRLRARSSETEEQLRVRLADARHELRYMDRYDYLVVNDRIPRAYKDLEAIVRAEHLRMPK